MRVAAVAAAAAAAGANVAADPCDSTGPTGEQIWGPTSPSDWSSWLAGMRSYRADCLKSIGYNGSIYNQSAIAWTRTAFMQPQMHPYDLYFYTQEGGYNVTGWLADLNTRYGGIDAALVWPTYTNIGIDAKNQFQHIAAMPGGINAISQFAAQLHSAGVRVLWPYNPWDTGTHRDDRGRSDAEMLAWLTNATNTDGFNGDTMGWVSEEFYQASLDLNHPIAIEPEAGGIAESLNWDTMGWGYWNYNQIAPPVSKWKWLEPRFTTNVCDRWNKNKTNNLQCVLRLLCSLCALVCVACACVRVSVRVSLSGD
jgi:iron(II)-dependent oxidoreductase